MSILNNMETAQAISALTNGAEWTWTGDDYSDINWVKIDADIPTEVEIEAKIEATKLDAVNEATAKAESKSLLLDRLGITADEAKLLLS
jgi:hypothetical protein